jgi:hypothetical protein
VWLTNSPEAASILSIAPQSGHTTSKILSFPLAISIRDYMRFRQLLAALASFTTEDKSALSGRANLA